MVRVSWGSPRTVKVPESRIKEYIPYGWEVLIRDSDMPPNPWDIQPQVEDD